jgi:hypothetical protein
MSNVLIQGRAVARLVTGGANVLTLDKPLCALAT